jgi:hypothetical protein
MQHHRTVQGPSGLRFSIDVPPVDGVRGFGVCDLLAVELQSSQVAGLVEEIEERQRVATEAFREATARWDAVPEGERKAGHPSEEDLAHAAYHLDLLSALRSQLPAVGGESHAMLVGPQSLIADVIWAAARNTAEDLVDLVRAAEHVHAAAPQALLDVARAALAFAASHVACLEITWFTFDAGVPSRPEYREATQPAADGS